MDSAADGLLALSSTIVGLAENVEDAHDDDRSSSLSELEDAPDNFDIDVESTTPALHAEQDSEAETERLEESPDKLNKRPFGISPSKLAQSTTIDDRPEIEALTDSGVSSPISPIDDSAAEESDDGLGAPGGKMKLLDQPLNNKRKRLSDVLDPEDQQRIRRRRTGSIETDDDKDVQDSDNEDAHSRGSREATIEPPIDIESRPPSDHELELKRGKAKEQEQPESSDEGKSKKPAVTSRATRRRGREQLDPDTNEADEDEAQESDEEVDVDDADAQAKSAEEHAKRAAAMEALSALEQRFATLRDRLYDERIAQINHELVQLAEPEPSHPELLRQLECVRRYRDEKFEIEQNLLVYKVTALKHKSIAERSQIHSAYFQTIRDIREKHVERISEQFYRIQQHRFKSNTPMPVYTIPFPEKRSQQITQQTAYNKEVSILSGVARYVGFPAAPELPPSHSKEIEDDMEKMGITLQPVRAKPSQRMASAYENSMSEKVAGQQFLEQTPWANPQHPMNRINMSRQASNKSPFNEPYLTPAHQQHPTNPIHPANSASTIAEHPSQPASSTLNTPMDHITNPKTEIQTNGILGNYRVSTSPTDTRKAMTSVFSSTRPASQPRDIPSTNSQQAMPSSPLTARANLTNSISPKRTSSAQPEKSRKETTPPFRQMSTNTNPSLTAGNGNGNGFGRFGLR